MGSKNILIRPLRRASPLSPGRLRGKRRRSDDEARTLLGQAFGSVPQLGRGVRTHCAMRCLVAGAALLAAFLPQPCTAFQTTASPTTSPLVDASAHLRTGDAEGALSLLNAALQTDPRNPKLLTLRALALDQMHQPEASAAAYAGALLAAPDYLPALEGLAQLRYRQGSPAAIAPIDHLLKLQPNDNTAHGMLAVLLFRQRDCSGAIPHFRAAGLNGESDPVALQEFTECLLNTGEVAAALPLLKRLLERLPGDARTREELAEAQSLSNLPEEAAVTLQPLLDVASPRSATLRLDAAIEAQRGNIPDAVQALRRALAVDPKDEEAYVQFASLANDAASYQAGVTLLNLGLAQLPESAPLYVARGVLYSQLAQYGTAVADFEQANRIDPNLAALGAARGVMQTQQKQDAAALETFREAAHKRPNDALTQYLLAEALTQRNLASTAADQAEAITAAERALVLDPTLTPAHNLLATIYLQSGQRELALHHSELALQQNPEDEQAIYHLILILRKGDRKAEVPGLVKRLSDLRDADAKRHPRYQLSVPAP